MDNEQHYNDQLLRYLDKEMSSDELPAFEKEILSNEQLRSELDNLEAARQAIILFGIKQQVAKIHREERTVYSKQAPVVKMNVYRSLIRYGAAAACIALIIVGVYRYNTTKLSADSLFAERYSRFEPSNSRGQSTAQTDIEKAYLQKDYGKVITLYKSGVAAGSKEMLITGNAYIETNEPAAAVEVFQSLLAKNKTDNTTSYNDAASYYLALAFLKNKNYAAAAGLMQQIQADKENAYSTKFSTEYIDRVKKLAAK